MCSKRIFANDYLGIDYIQYNKIKNGCEILKSIKIEDNIAILDRFKNYNMWQTLNTSYFKYIDNNTVDVQYVQNIYSANQSFIDKQNITDDNPIYESCTTNQYLYPYGNIIEKTQISPSYSTKLYLCKWCNNKSPINNIPTYIPPDDINIKCICKNRKPLFI